MKTQPHTHILLCKLGLRNADELLRRNGYCTHFSASECEAEEASDEEAPDSPRRVDSYHAFIKEMVGVRINSTIPINTDSSLTKVALDRDTASRLWHITT